MTNEPSSIAQAIRPAPPKICTYELPLVRIVQETPDTFTYEFNLRSDQPFAYWPGQWAFLALKKPEGTAVKRAFSFSSTPTRPGTVAFTIKLLKGEFTALLEGLQPGAPFQVKGPFGEFGFKDSVPPSLVFIAGGTGITPLMSMIRYVTDKNLATPMRLFSSVRSAPDIIYREELERLAAAHPALQLHITVTRDAAGWPGPCGRLTKDILAAQLGGPDAHAYFLCGPDKMIEDVTALLDALGVDKPRIKRESWG